jgi:hypothetical protein
MTDPMWSHVVYIFFHRTNIYSLVRLILSSSISSLSTDYPFKATGRGRWCPCSLEPGVLASCWPAHAHQARGACRLLATRLGVLVEHAVCAHQLLSHRCSPNIALTASRRCSPNAVPPLGHWWASCVATNLCTGIKLRNDEPPFVQATRWYFARKHMLQAYVSSV